MPAAFAVGMLSPFAGDVGESAATFSGGIALDPTLPTQNGKGVVFAADPTAAIQSALVNTVVVTFSGQTANYTPSTSTVGGSTGTHLPFVVVPTATPGVYTLVLEDLSLMPGATPDWDYNDRTWTVRVTELPVISVSGTAGQETADGSAPVVFTLTRTVSTPALLSEPLVVPFTLNGTAVPGTDYTPPSALLAVFWPGETVTHIPLPVIDDPNTEGQETIIITPDPGDGFVIDPSDPNDSRTITDPPSSPPPASPPTPALPVVSVTGSFDGVERADGLRPVVFRLSRSNPTPNQTAPALTVGFSPSGTATPVVDYAIPAFVATFAAGELTTTVVLNVADDTLVEGTESVGFTITPRIGYAVGTGQGTASLFDNDVSPPPTPPTPALPEVWVSGSLDGEERPDGLRPVAFQLTRTSPVSPAPALTVGFDLTGVATPGADYTAPYWYTATFAPGELTTWVALSVVTDELNEGDESTVLTLTPSSGYTVTSGMESGTADIFDLGTLPPARGTASVSGTVWLDLVRNDLQDPFNPVNDAPRPDVRVTLLDGNGSVFLSTYTDGGGNYSFTRLPYGQYRVLVSLWGLERFVQPNYGGSQFDQIDSDVDANGLTDVFELTPANPNADRDAGVYLADPPANAADKSIHIMLPGHTPAAELKVAKWWFKDKKKNEAFVDGANNLPRLKGVDKGGFDFIDEDPDRFNVYVKDTTHQQDWLDVEIRTKKKDANGQVGADNDNPTKIRLIRMDKDPNSIGPWEHWFWSDSQLLVSNEADDKFERAVAAVPGDPNGKTGGGVGKDDTDPGVAPNAGKFNGSFPLSDRTHRVALGEVVKVQYGNSVSEVEVKVRKTLNLRVRILVDPNLPAKDPENDGVRGQVIKKADVEADIARMKELYAQMGIKVVEDITVDTVPAAEQNPGTLPAVDLTDGLTTFTAIFNDIFTLSDELKALFKNISNGNGNANGRTPTVGQVNGEGGVDDVEVYYANYLTRPRLPPGNKIRGQAFPRLPIKDEDESKHADTVVISTRDRATTTLAHEVFHVLENYTGGHYPYTGDPAFGAQRANLMVVGDDAVNEQTPNGPADQVIWSVRLNQAQQDRADTGADGGDPKKSKLLS